MTDTQEFTPLTMRGTALMRAIFDMLVEEAQAARDRVAKLYEAGEYDEAGQLEDEMTDSRIGRWDQGTWGYLDAVEMASKGVDVEALFREQHPNLITGREYNIIVPSGVAETLCGTACCFAGHTALMVGDLPVLDLSIGQIRRLQSGVAFHRRIPINQVIPVELANYVDYGDELGLPSFGIRTRAAVLLDLSYDEAEMLFAAHNSLDDIQKMVEWKEAGNTLQVCDACDEGLPIWECPYEGLDVCPGCNEHVESCSCDYLDEDEDDED